MRCSPTKGLLTIVQPKVWGDQKIPKIEKKADDG